MKTFKKQLMACILTAAMAVCTFAIVTPANAATPTARQYISKMNKAVQKAKSYEFKQTSQMTGSISGQSFSNTQTQKQIYFKKPLKIKTVTTSKMKMPTTSGTTRSLSYTKKASNGHYYLYQATGGNTYDKTDITDMTSNTTSMDYFSSAKIVKKGVKVNGVNTIQISAQIEGKSLGKMMEQLGMGDLFSQAGVDFSTLKPMKATIWINQKTYLPVKTKNDSTAFINSYMENLYSSMGISGSNATYSKFITTTTYSKFNKASSFKIPKECK